MIIKSLKWKKTYENDGTKSLINLMLDDWSLQLIMVGYYFKALQEIKTQKEKFGNTLSREWLYAFDVAISDIKTIH